MNNTTKQLIDILSDNDNLLGLLNPPKEFRGLTVKINIRGMYPHLSIYVSWDKDIKLIISISEEIGVIIHKGETVKTFNLSIGVLKATLLLMIDTIKDTPEEEYINIMQDIVKSSSVLSILYECVEEINQAKRYSEKIKRNLEAFSNAISIHI